MKKQQKIDGMVLVDAWLIPEEEVAQYIEDREEAAKRIEEALLTFCVRVERGGQNSQDGEFLTGVDENGEYCVLIHLDPDGVEAVKETKTLQELVCLLKEEE